jgi:hypothetical protein
MAKFYIPLFLILFIFNLFSCSFKNKDRDALFNKVVNGMSKEQVIEILGEPNAIGRSSVDSEFVFFYYYPKNIFGKNESRSVSFSNSGKVELVRIDED